MHICCKRYWLLLLPLCLTGCYPNQPTIRGKLVDGDTGEPLVGAVMGVQLNVKMASLGGPWSGCLGVGGAKTDNDGLFALPSWKIVRKGFSLQSSTSVWQVYKPGYELVVGHLPLKHKSTYSLRPVPAKVRTQPNHEYYLRYLLERAKDLSSSWSDCYGHFDGAPYLGETRVHFTREMSYEAEPLASSPYEHFLADAIKATLQYGYKDVLRPRIDVVKTNNNLPPREWNWDEATMTWSISFDSSGKDTTPSKRTVVVCSAGRDDACDVNTRRASGNTLLMDKIENIEFVEHLLKRGADPGIENAWTGESALSLLLKAVREKRNFNDPAALKVMRLLTGDRRTRLTDQVRKETADIEKLQLDTAGNEFLLEIKDRVRILPEGDPIMRLGESFLREHGNVNSPKR